MISVSQSREIERTGPYGFPVSISDGISYEDSSGIPVCGVLIIVRYNSNFH